MKNKAIFFTTYNRPDYLSETLDSWQNVRGIEDYDIYFRVDPSEHTENIIEQISKFSNKINADVRTILNLEKQGCAHNTWNGFDQLFNTYNFVILTEDDILPSTDRKSVV
jgi:hypothetical protein